MSKWVNFRESLKLKIGIVFSDIYEKAKEIIIGVWTKSKPAITKELMTIAVGSVRYVNDNRKDLIGKDAERRHEAQNIFKAMLKENKKIAGENIKDSVINALLEMAVVEMKF
jgi:hypothetical protein